MGFGELPDIETPPTEGIALGYAPAYTCRERSFPDATNPRRRRVAGDPGAGSAGSEEGRRSEKGRFAARPPSFPRDRKAPSERAQGHRGPDRLPQHRLSSNPRPDGVAERGRARQVGLRPLLRAHDVPGHE